MGVVVITGTSSGIGLSAAVELARRGERVVATMRDVSRAGDLRAACGEVGVEVDIAALDVTNDDSVRSCVEEVLERHERIDVAVNNAGIMPAGPLELTSDELAREVFDTNVLGPLRVARAVLPHMRAQASGRIVNVSSPADPRHGLRMVGLYVASKAALNALSMELAKEVRGFGIEVVVLQTGMGGATKMLTGLADQLADWAADTSAYADVKKIGAAQLAAMVEGSTDTAPSARLVADAVTVESPGLRFPADQAFADSWRDITDDEFVRLCDGADPAPIHRHHDIRWSFWLTGR